MAFPPIPVYPEAIDSDYTLFLVHNTTETKLSSDNSPWSQEINIIPVDADKQEIWSDNGFGNIEGELFYYDSVEKDVNGKVNKLKGCSRQLGGEKTRLNKKGTWIRSFVVAEHHNQLVETILKIENFVGFNFDERQETLDWRIRNLQELPIIFDDYSCPDINFTFNVIENDPEGGILAEYIIEITPPGSINNFKLDFGDGDFTTTSLSGQHRYALNASVDPVVSVFNDKCEIIQTPIVRSNPQEPSSQVQQGFDIPIPEIPEFPDFTFVPCDVPEPDITLPPLILPCISLEGQIGPLPSIITGPDINLVSNVTITGPDQPVQILHSQVEIIGGPINIPPVIIIDPPIPPTIIIDPPIPPTIVIVPPQSNITVELNAMNLPMLEVNWGRPPDMAVALTMSRAVNKPARFAVEENVIKEFGEEFADLFEASKTMKVEYEPVGIPEEIRIIAPDIPRIEIDSSSLPRDIKIVSNGVNIPTDIQIHGPESPIPNSIKFDASDLPEEIDLVYKGKPIPVDVKTTVEIKMDNKIPEEIVVKTPNPIPSRIIVESDIPHKIVFDGPTSIPITLPENFVLPVKFPDVMPEVEMVWKGSPIEVKITMDEILSRGEDKNQQCVMIVPCPR